MDSYHHRHFFTVQYYPYSFCKIRTLVLYCIVYNLGIVGSRRFKITNQISRGESWTNDRKIAVRANSGIDIFVLTMTNSMRDSIKNGSTEFNYPFFNNANSI